MLFEPIHRPLTAFDALRGVQAELRRLLAEPGAAAPLSLALYRRENALLLRTPLPGATAKDIALEIDGDVLTLSGELAEEPEAGTALAHHVERPRGKFTRTLRLPFEVDAARVQARFERGVLEVELPRLERNPPVKIQVLPAAPKN